MKKLCLILTVAMIAESLTACSFNTSDDTSTLSSVAENTVDVVSETTTETTSETVSENTAEEMSDNVSDESSEYAPFDIDQIVKDMRKYGESHGMTWNDSKYVKFNDKTDPHHQDPITNSSFCIPVDTRVTGLTLKQQLLDSVLWPYEENKVYNPYLKLEEMSFKVVPLYCKADDFWEFYVLY